MPSRVETSWSLFLVLPSKNTTDSEERRNVMPNMVLMAVWSARPIRIVTGWPSIMYGVLYTMTAEMTTGCPVSCMWPMFTSCHLAWLTCDSTAIVCDKGREWGRYVALATMIGAANEGS